MQLHVSFKKHLCIFFTPIDLSRYSVHRSVRFTKNE